MTRDGLPFISPKSSQPEASQNAATCVEEDSPSSSAGTGGRRLPSAAVEAIAALSSYYTAHRDKTMNKIAK
jgi:hypothetical protein